MNAKDGFSRPFDKKASGYVRSEAIGVLILQKSINARRCYATLVHSKINSDGFKPEGITYPSCKVQKQLLEAFYNEIEMDPNSIAYIEAHATGTSVGDPEECKAICEIFCQNRKEPLLIGSVKSNLGHTEAMSGICSVVKSILALETNLIAPNINYEDARDDIIGLKDGYLKVVDQVSDLPGSIIACNSFGFGGANGHALLLQNGKTKINYGIPKDSVPRLVCFSGRTEEACDSLYNEISRKPLDAELVALIHKSQTTSMKSNHIRSYAIFEQNQTKSAICTNKEIVQNMEKRPLVFIFSGMGSQWLQMSDALMVIPIFRNTLEKCQKILEKEGYDLMAVLKSEKPETYDNALNCFVGITAIQIAFFNILKEMKVSPDYVLGHSAGEIGCAYADNCLTLEETILCAYSRGVACLESDLIQGAMAGVGLGAEQMQPLCPEGIEVACHNGPTSCTVSGPVDLIKAFVTDFQKQGIFAREGACAQTAFHSRYIQKAGPKLLERLKNVIKSPKPRSKKWISTSVPYKNWNNPEAITCSAEYQANNLLNPVLFEEGLGMLPSDSITLEIAPHGLLQSTLRRTLLQGQHISLMQKEHENNLQIFLNGLGK